MNEHDLAPDAEGLDADLLLRLSAEWLLKHPDRERYLQHMADHAPAIFADALTDDPEELRRAPMSKVLRSDAPRFFRGLGWQIASAMPLPCHDWQPQRMPLPGRNDPCLCGSGAKFKHCCARLIEGAPRPDPVWLGALVVQALPARDRALLPQSRVAPQSVVAAAHDWAEHDRARDALRLLEPWSRLPAPWPAARVELLDLLADLYLELGHPRKRQALADAMVERGDPVVQSLGWQRRSMMAADRGDTAAARDAFERAQRLTPDDPRIALLEVTMLLGSAEFDRAHERAAFHARRLARLPQAAGLQSEIDSLNAIARGEMDHLGQPPGAGGGGGDDEDDDGDADADMRAVRGVVTVFDELAGWVADQPPARLRLDLARATEHDLGELLAAKALRPHLRDWQQVFGQVLMDPGPRGPAGLQALGGERWMPLLRRQPALLDSFDVLDDLLNALQVVPMGLAARLQAALMQRALDLWALLRARYPAARCEWGWLGNRPALRLLADSVHLDTTPSAERSFDALRALVEVLNPNDNQGLRERLAAVLLRRGDAAAALALCERYPDDFVGLQLLHARSLLALQRLPEAQAVFAAALKDNPHVLKLLRAPRAPRMPEVASFRVGSPEQAKISVANQHDLWRDKALQAWLKGPDGAAGAGAESLQLTLT